MSGSLKTDVFFKLVSCSIVKLKIGRIVSAKVKSKDEVVIRRKQLVEAIIVVSM